jgi:hypothetical protein
VQRDQPAATKGLPGVYQEFHSLACLPVISETRLVPAPPSGAKLPSAGKLAVENAAFPIDYEIMILVFFREACAR